MQATRAKNFIVVRNRQSFGPYTASQLHRLAHTNRLMLDDFVCRVGSLEKSQVRKIPSLCVLLNPARELERKNCVVEQGAKSQDASALQTAIYTYNQRKACRPDLPQAEPSGGTSKKPSIFRTDEVLCYGEFDLKTYQTYQWTCA